MRDQPTTGYLVRALVITAAEIEALVANYEATPGAGPLPLGKRYKLDVDKAIDACPPAAQVINDPASEDAQRWTVICNAIFRATPELA